MYGHHVWWKFKYIAGGLQAAEGVCQQPATLHNSQNLEIMQPAQTASEFLDPGIYYRVTQILWSIMKNDSLQTELPPESKKPTKRDEACLFILKSSFKGKLRLPCIEGRRFEYPCWAASRLPYYSLTVSYIPWSQTTTMQTTSNGPH